MQNQSETLVTVETGKKLGITEAEFEQIVSIMGRTPNFTELSIYSVMWSEHCSYKNSIHWLKTLPREGKRLLVGAGEENAGLVDIGDGLACAFKIESHNHPSAIDREGSGAECPSHRGGHRVRAQRESQEAWLSFKGLVPKGKHGRLFGGYREGLKRAI